MAQRQKILLLIPHLGGGGAEKVIALLARDLSHEKFEVHLGLITQSSVEEGETPSWVKVHALGVPRVRRGALRLLRLVWRVRPDVILSGIAHLNFLVLLLKPLFPRSTRVLVRQNGTVSSTLTRDSLPPYTRFLYQALYRHADRVICQSSAMASDLQQVIRLNEEQIAVLPNPIDYASIQAADGAPSRWSGAGPHLLAIGRLAPEKGFDLLLRALAEILPHHPTAELILLGTGPEAASLQALCRTLHLESAVRFAGHEKQPFAYYSGATLFVLSSRHEGMPNALLEALAGGLPIVATPASGGVADLLRDRPQCWLAPEISAPALAETLQKALLHLQK